MLSSPLANASTGCPPYGPGGGDTYSAILLYRIGGL